MSIIKDYCLWKMAMPLGECWRTMPDPLSSFFGKAVRIRRLKTELSQESLAERASVHATYVGLVERGKRNCSIDVADAFAQALEVQLSVLIGEAASLREKVTGRKVKRS